MIDEKNKLFIENHLKEDVASLALKGVDKFIVQQISGRQKIAKKIPLIYNNFNLILPKKLSIEQSSSETTAKYKAKLFSGKVGVDLSGGLGVDTIFLSKRFEKFIYVENDKELFEITKYNFNKLELNNIELFNENAENILNKIENVDLIYLDPARRKDSQKVFTLTDSSPNLVELFHKIIKKTKNYLFKLSPLIDLSSVEKELKSKLNFQAIKYQNELKELLVTNLGNKLTAVDLDKNNFSYFNDDHSDIVIKDKGKYIYEAQPEILKLKLSDKIANENNLFKAANNTNLYFSEQATELKHFSVYRILKILDANKTELKKIAHTKAIVKSRNYYLSPNEIRKRFKINEGSDIIYFFYRNENNKGKIAISEKMERK